MAYFTVALVIPIRYSNIFLSSTLSSNIKLRGLIVFPAQLCNIYFQELYYVVNSLEVLFNPELKKKIWI